MRKIQILGAAFFAVLAFGAVSAANAFAVKAFWLNLANVEPNKASATTEGLLLLHQKKIPFLSGGGEVTAHCEGKFDGTVGLGSLDEVTKVLNTKGEEVTKAKPLSCVAEPVAKENVGCKAGALVSVSPDNLSVTKPWKTELTGELGGLVFDDFTTAEGNGVGYTAVCAGVEVLCATRLDRAHFDENKAGGALFLFLGELVAGCTNGAEATVLGHGEVIDFFVH